MMHQQNIPIVQGVAVPSGGYGRREQHPQQAAYQPQQAAYQPQQAAYQPQQTGYAQAGYNQQDQYQPQSEFNGTKGESQPKQFQDVFWSVLFGVHLLIMVIIMAVMSGSLESSGYNYSGVVWCVSMCALVAVGLSTMALGFMMQFATEMVKMALFFSVGCSLVMGILGAMAGQMWMSIVGFGSFAIGCCYAYMVWGRIPVSYGPASIL
jgi:cation transport ATPase